MYMLLYIRCTMPNPRMSEVDPVGRRRRHPLSVKLLTMYPLSDKARLQFNMSVACAVISTITVIIRIYCKIWHKQGVRSDDFWIIAGLASYCASVATIPIVVWNAGGGTDLTELLEIIATDPSKIYLIEKYLKGEFLGSVFITCATYAIKMSILFFYRRVLLVTQGYRRISLSLMIVSTCWVMGTEIATLLVCQPVEAFWHREKPGKCSNFNALFLGTTLVDTIIDLVILILPLRIVLTLHLPIRTKIAVAGIYVLGGLAVITNVIRIQYIYQPHRKNVSFAAAWTWSNIHLLTAIVCACLPVYKPLWVSISQRVEDKLKQYASLVRKMPGKSSDEAENSIYVRMASLGKLGDTEALKHQKLPSDTFSSEGNMFVRFEAKVFSGHDMYIESLHMHDCNIARF
ncbi:hypothetical protein PMIN05_011760 [Paraphaeosphaeria minitans]